MPSTSTWTISSLGAVALPGFVGILGLAGVSGGVYGLLSPIEAGRQFGITTSSTTSPGSSSSSTEIALIRALALRNLATGATNLALTLMWQFSSLSRASPVVAHTFQQALGIGLLLGTSVAIGDAYVLIKYAKSSGLGSQASRVGREKSKGHAFTALPIFVLGLSCCLV